MKKKKIAILTSTRAEYGLLSNLMHAIDNDDELELQVIVTGAHLSPEFGLTYRFIEEDGFNITAKVEMLMSSDTAIGITKSMGLCLISASEVLHRCLPDLLLLLGDRYETLAVATAALMQKIPIAHLHGGELSEGAIDDAIRHAITKLSHLHFVAADAYRKRVVQLGENPDNVFNVGAPGLERIHNMSLLNLNELQKKINFQLDGPLNFLLTYHPATLAIDEDTEILTNLFASLDQFPEAKMIITLANADETGRSINRKMTEYAARHPDRAKVFVTLGDLNYLSLLQFVDIVIGNSSSGIVEVPYFHKPSINIGNRQTKRLRASTIIDCSGHGDSIVNAIKKALSPDFQAGLSHPTLQYKQDKTVEKITTIIKQTDLNKLMMKQFYDVSML